MASISTASGSNEDKTLRGGDVRIIKLDLQDSNHEKIYDLTSIWKNISIYEDIETNYIRGELTVVDSKNILMDAPILTNEKLTIEFKTPGHPKNYKFVAAVTEVTSQIIIKQGMQAYVIRFISPEFVRNQKSKFSKAYNEMLISDMVNSIYASYIKITGNKIINIVPTTETISRVVPTMSPYKAINWLAKWAKATTYTKGASYLFFENQHGFYFGPIEALVDENINKKPAATYTRDNIHGQEGSPKKDIKLGFYNIINLEIDTPDMVKNISSGFYSSKLLTHDLVLRQIGTHTFDYFGTYKSMTHLAKNTKKEGMELTALHNDTRLGAYTDSYIVNAPKHYSWYGPKQTTNFVEDTVLARTSQLAQLGAVQLGITVPGDSSRTVGEVVEIKLPAVGTTTLEAREGELDKYLSGRYLIATIRHELVSAEVEGERDVYSLKMNVVKDSYMTPLPKQIITHWI